MAELPDGVAKGFSSAGSWAATALDIVAAERCCCPVIAFELVFEPDDGPVRPRGSGAIKALVLAEFDRITPRAETGA